MIDEGASSAWRSFVYGLLGRIDYDDPAMFSQLELILYSAQAKGVDLHALGAKLGIPESQSSLEVSLLFGQKIIDLMRKEDVENYLPMNDLVVMPTPRVLMVVIRSLRYHRTEDGRTFYSSPRQPTVKCNGKERKIAFSRHAMTRACERIVPDWDDMGVLYGRLGDAFGFFMDCVHFEPLTLPNGQPGFTFFQSCFLHMEDTEVKHYPCEYFRCVASREEQAKLTREVDRHNWYFRVGYCPVVEIGEYWVAKTLLFPGYMNTPEYAALKNSALSRTKAADMMWRARGATATAIATDWDFSLMRWFHENGIPQVVYSRTPFFRSDLGSGSIGGFRNAALVKTKGIQGAPGARQGTR